MKTALTIAPPPPVRRHRQMSLEPVVFAALLMALTLGINMYVPSLRTADDTAHKAHPAESAAPAQVAQAN